MEDIRLGNRVKLARVENNLTQAQLAELVGVTRQTIGLIEAGKYNPTIKLCLMIAQVTGKSLDQLFWTEKEDPLGLKSLAAQTGPPPKPRTQ